MKPRPVMLSVEIVNGLPLVALKRCVAFQLKKLGTVRQVQANVIRKEK